MKSRIAVFASGNGTNAEEIFKYFKNNPSSEVVLLLSNDADAFAIERAKGHGIPTRVFSREQFRNGEVLLALREFRITHIVLAGFLWLIPMDLLTEFSNKIINIHPALLPKFGGKGMYGLKVHESVKASSEVETGITIHLVNERYDEGKILFQAKCLVNRESSVLDIARDVARLEHLHFPRVIDEWISGDK